MKPSDNNSTDKTSEIALSNLENYKISPCDHRIIISSRRFGRFGGLKMAFNNAHHFWKIDRKLKEKSEFKFWYDVRE